MKTHLRTHTCGELSARHKNEIVTLAGWVNAVRSYGKLTFLDIRDRFGLTQVVLNEKYQNFAKGLKPESVVQIKGPVRLRPKDLVRKDMPTGEIEIECTSCDMLNASEKLPIDISGLVQSNEDTRLKYRYLDLRNPKQQEYLRIRHEATRVAMNFFDKLGFYHITTPMLVKSTPEGARDYVVPSRVNKGQFYALPQSPQLYKQILMVAGFDRYFQFAICLRDEDLRADRQPEFMQIDFEMSFVAKEDVFAVVEGVIKEFWNIIGMNITTPFRQLSYHDAIDQYGSDKPDLRFGLKLQDVTALFKTTDFEAFKKSINSGHVVRALVLPQGMKHYSKKHYKDFENLAKVHHAPGVVTLEVIDEELHGTAAQFFSTTEKKKLRTTLSAKNNDLILLVADKHAIASTALGQLRLKAGEDLKLTQKNSWEFAWIIDFPLFEFSEEKKCFEPAHHPFCMPYIEHMKYFDTGELDKIYCNHYDLTLNGVELLSGSIRINKPDIQEKVFKAMGISHEKAREKFGFLLEAFKYGAPPHGGGALGFDRIVALLCGLKDIREVIAFPKNKNAQNPMDGSPSPLSNDQIHELGLFLYEE